MAKLPTSALFKIVMQSKSSKRFLLATIFSFAFSMTVILGTIGLMDGFVLTLKGALAHSNGDIKFLPSNDFFNLNEKLKAQLVKAQPGIYTGVLEIESFALLDEESKGVLLRGVEIAAFKEITDLPVDLLKDGVLIGKKFQEKYKLNIGDSIVLAFSTQKRQERRQTHLETFVIDGIVEHGIHEKDIRFVYINKTRLEETIGYRPGSANMGLVKLDTFNYLDQAVENLNKKFRDKLFFQPYWSEFKTMLEAVEMEKYSISLILQLIVIVAIINIVGFIIFIAETKAQDFFMLRALGLSMKSYRSFWYFLLVGIWLFSCLFAKGFIVLLDEVILRLPFLKFPGDIYVLTDFSISLTPLDYVYVYGLALVWVILVGFITMKKQSKKTLLSGLRQEFS